MKPNIHFSKTELLKKTVFSFEIAVLIIVGIIGLILVFNAGDDSNQTNILGLISVFLVVIVAWILALFVYRNYVLNDILKQLEKNNFVILEFTLSPTKIEFQKQQQAFILKTEDISLRNIDFVLEPTNRIKTKHKNRNKWKREARTYFYTPKVTQKLLDFTEK
ncbi:hypothetical protein Fleli_2789 [Bernardetia litoralis DSM 6794]|uniref:Uncharacterized protein n=1 Tax=Bernardetia litoralis (strain ATCC 23117 / DSM 6794 / NBRC 15988 / NCIMB 1366 / Fx l1 / Sio-4) TaxID=880071 RepID=I4AMF7_BERLS|nr:hypothetical protein [Bernardetia litoralis]AFM05142.1 hypothetical protein Fleli_2789 [Bernardetia litoralis DSM 6794]